MEDLALISTEYFPDQPAARDGVTYRQTTEAGAYGALDHQEAAKMAGFTPQEVQAALLEGNRAISVRVSPSFNPWHLVGYDTRAMHFSKIKYPAGKESIPRLLEEQRKLETTLALLPPPRTEAEQRRRLDLFTCIALLELDRAERLYTNEVMQMSDFVNTIKTWHYLLTTAVNNACALFGCPETQFALFLEVHGNNTQHLRVRFATDSFLYRLVKMALWNKDDPSKSGDFYDYDLKLNQPMSGMRSVIENFFNQLVADIFIAIIFSWYGLRGSWRSDGVCFGGPFGNSEVNPLNLAHYLLTGNPKYCPNVAKVLNTTHPPLGLAGLPFEQWRRATAARLTAPELMRMFPWTAAPAPGVRVGSPPPNVPSVFAPLVPTAAARPAAAAADPEPPPAPVTFGRG